MPNTKLSIKARVRFRVILSGLVIGLVRVRIRPGVGFYKQNPPKTLFSFL